MKALFCFLFLLTATSCDPEPQTKQVPEAPKKATQVPSATQSLSHDEFRDLAVKGSPEAISTLLRFLGGTPSERIWAAFALGLICSEKRHADIERGLVGAVARYASEPTPADPELLRTAGWALGACASPQAEEILRTWLNPDPALTPEGLLEAGVFGLGAVADRTSTLMERTQTALLDAASRAGRADLLQPLGRVSRLSDAVGAHMLEVAGSLLTQESLPGRRHAIIALGSAGASAAEPLGQLLLQDRYEPVERAAAAEALGRLGEAGQTNLDKIIGEMLERGLPLSHERPLWIPLRAALLALENPRTAKIPLAKLRGLVLPEGDTRAKKAQRRRLVWLRCRAFDLLAQDREKDAALLDCDPDHGREQKLALLRVLDRGRLEKSRLATFRELAAADDPVVAQAALRLLSGHSEVTEAQELIQAALDSTVPGTIATACQIVAAHPSRVLSTKEDTAKTEKLIQRLSALLADADQALPLETRLAAIQAAGALGALSLKPALEDLCKAEASALRTSAGQALGLLGAEKGCPQAPASEHPSKSKADQGEPAPVIIEVDSDVGVLELHLDRAAAPKAAERFLKLMDEGYYENTTIFGGRPGFATQFGDRNGDGYEDKALASLPSELSPTPFRALSFGLSEFSPGSQSSQIFVMLTDAPQLTGARIHLGQAKGPWHLLTTGDVLYRLRRR